MKIMKGSFMLFRAHRKHNLYMCTTVMHECDNANVVHNDHTQLWHSRLGHMSNKGLHILKNAGAFGNDHIDNVSFWDACVFGKQHKVQFPVFTAPNVTSCSRILEYLHADVWGPSCTPTQGGNKYFLSIIDDFSRKVWVFLMKNKSDVFENFKNWKTVIENQTGKKIGTLRTDNGLEFCNAQLEELCVQSGIKRHKSVPYTPQQNGVAERMNRTLLEKVRSMTTPTGLAKSFWGEAVVTAAYLVNRSPSVPLLGKIPEAVFWNKNIDLSNLKVCGCAAFVHQRGDKLDPRAKKCVFLGYPEGVKGYRLWDRSLPGFKAIIRRDVTFNEFEFPCFPVNTTFSSEVEHSPSLSNVNVSLPVNDAEPIPVNDDLPIPENAEHVEHDVNADLGELSYYMLARDRIRRTIKKPVRYNDVNLLVFALHVFELLRWE